MSTAGTVVDRATLPYELRLDDHVTRVAWSADGIHLACATIGGDTVVTRPLDGGRVVQLDRHEPGVLDVDWRDDELLVAGQDGRVTRWSAATDTATEVWRGRGWVQAVAWSPVASHWAAAAGRTVVFDGVAVDELDATGTDVVWTPDGRRVGVATYGGVRWYDGTTGAPERRFDWKGSLLALAMAPNGRWLAGGAQDASVHLWRLWSAEELQMSGYPAKLEVLAFDPGSRWLAVGSVGELNLWDFAGKGPRGSRPKRLDGFERRITAVAWTGPPSAPVLAAACADGTVAVWTVGKAVKRVARYAFDDEPGALAWHPDGRHLAFGTGAGRVGVLRVG